MQSASVPQSQLDYNLLELRLCETLYSDIDRLRKADPDELIEYLFREHYVFLFSSHELSAWYNLFRGEAYRLLALRGIPHEKTEYRLRSSSFIHYAQHIMRSIKTEAKLTVPPPPTPAHRARI